MQGSDGDTGQNFPETPQGCDAFTAVPPGGGGSGALLVLTLDVSDLSLLSCGLRGEGAGGGWGGFPEGAGEAVCTRYLSGIGAGLGEPLPEPRPAAALSDRATEVSTAGLGQNLEACWPLFGTCSPALTARPLLSLLPKLLFPEHRPPAHCGSWRTS